MKIKIELCHEPLSALPPSFPTDGEGGALVEFYGIVRKEEGPITIPGLDYEAYSAMAEKKLHQIIEEIANTLPSLSVHLRHRLGHVPAGEPSLWVQVIAVHRREAIQMASTLIDRMKEEVPIWKATPPRRESS